LVRGVSATGGQSINFNRSARNSCGQLLLVSAVVYIANNKRLTFTSDWLAMGGRGRGNISAISIVFWFSYRKLFYGIYLDWLCLLHACFFIKLKLSFTFHYTENLLIYRSYTVATVVNQKYVLLSIRSECVTGKLRNLVSYFSVHTCSFVDLFSRKLSAFCCTLFIRIQFIVLTLSLCIAVFPIHIPCYKGKIYFCILNPSTR